MYHKSIDLHEQVTDYCETLLGVDDSIGAMLDYLESSNQSDESLFIYMGDNGFSWGEHGLIDKRHFYEESARVPLLFYSPSRIEAGQVNQSLILNTDIAPTILDYARAKIPDHYVGQSIKPTFNSKETYKLRDTISVSYTHLRAHETR